MSIVALQSGVFLAAVILTGLFLKIARQMHFLDLPVARSSHSRPTPVGGGISIVLLFLLSTSYFYLQGLIPLMQFLAILGTGIVATVGFVDDLLPLDVQWRVPPQVLAALWVVWCLGDIPPIQVGSWQLANPWFIKGLSVLGLLWLLNLYNFMDGIDGLAGSELVFVTLVSLSLVITSGDQVVTVLCGTLLAAAAGFLLWNWPPAKIFMGDVGSGFAGFCLGVIALISMQSGSLSLWTWVILLAVFIVDATVTLLRRYWRGEKWWEGHATHAYQHAARRYKSHVRVTITVMVINLVWLAPLAWLSVARPEYGVYLCLLAVAPLVFLAIRLGAGTPAKL